MKKRKKSWSSKSGCIFPPAVLAAGLAGAVYAWRKRLKRSLPSEDDRFVLQGVEGAVEILRDRWGVPHIYAKNDRDLFFGQGFVHAQDRLFQMDTFRRVGAGRISELVGPEGLPSDRFARYIGWKKAAEVQISHADAEVRDVMAAYCAGVNAFIKMGKLPIECTLLMYKPELWRFFDTAVWGSVLSWGLSVNWETELLRSLLLDAVGPEKAFDLTHLCHDEYKTIIPDAQVGRRLARSLMGSYQQAILSMPLGRVPTGKGVGSNNWVVSGQRTVTGRPILANDPHLPPLFPPFWYENHLVGGSFHVTGFSMPGVPGVIIGHNDQVAWGVTNAFPDVQDIYIERFHEDDPSLYEVNGRWQEADIVTEEIKVRGRKKVVETVRFTRHGPVFSDLLPHREADLSLRWASHSPSNQLRAFLDMNRAATAQEFHESMRTWGFASQNVVYADVGGNIGYTMPGLVPRRKKGHGLLPVPGWDNKYEWVGWIPFEELPRISNPPEEMIVTANNRVHGSSYPHLLTGEWLPDYRARRIWELLEAGTPLTLEANGRIQDDTVSLLMRRFVTSTAELLELDKSINGALGKYFNMLCAWNGDMRQELIEPTIAFGWIVHFTRAAFDQAVGPVLAGQLLEKGPPESFPMNPFQETAAELIVNWLEYGSPPWIGDIRPLLLPALQKTIQILRKELGNSPNDWQWGKLHIIDLQHPLTRVPGLGRTWKPLKIPVGGDGYTVNQSEVSLKFPPEPVGIIASCRMIMDVGAWDNSLAVLPGGQSGHPASAHYQDGLDDWRNGRYHPMLFSRERIEQELEGTTMLVPRHPKGK